MPCPSGRARCVLTGTLADLTDLPARPDFEDSLSAEDAFAMLGKDRLSTLDVKEFTTVVRMLLPTVKKKRARTLFGEVDEDQGGTISLSELKAYWPTLIVECARLRAERQAEKERKKKVAIENRFAASLPSSARIAVKEMTMYFVLLFFFLFAMGSRRNVRDHFNYVDSLSRELRDARFGTANELVWEEVKSEVCGRRPACGLAPLLPSHRPRHHRHPRSDAGRLVALRPGTVRLHRVPNAGQERPVFRESRRLAAPIPELPHGEPTGVRRPASDTAMPAAVRCLLRGRND